MEDSRFGNTVEVSVGRVTAEAAALSRMFSAAVFRDLANRGASPLFARLAKQSGAFCAPRATDTVAAAFDTAFTAVNNLGVRDEYVYRSALIQRRLLGRHSLKTATLVTEMRAGASKADAVVLNGTATAYEIKSDRDSLARLGTQIEDYRQVFASVTVVCSEHHLDAVARIVPGDVGLTILRRPARGRPLSLSDVRPPIDLPERTAPLAVLGALRVGEAREIALRLGCQIPNVPNTQMYRTLRDIFATLQPQDVHREMVSVVKHSRSQAALAPVIMNIPAPLQAAALTNRSTGAGLNLLRRALSTPLTTALDWE